MEDTIDKQTAYKALAESIRLALDGKQNWGDVLDALKVVDNIEECESPMTDKNLYRIWGL